MSELGRALDVKRSTGFRQAVAGGAGTIRGARPSRRLKRVPPGPTKRPPRPRRGLTLNQARALVEEISESLGGEPAGIRAWRTRRLDFAVVCPRIAGTKILAPSSSCSPIVVRGRARGAPRGRRDSRRIAVRASRSPPASLRHRSRHATGRPSTWRPSARSPMPRTKRLGPPASAHPRPSCANGPSAASHRGSSKSQQIRGDLHVTPTGRTARLPCSRWRSSAGARLRVHRRVRPHAERLSLPGLDADDLRRQAEQIAARTSTSRRFGSCAARSATSQRTVPRPPRRRASRARWFGRACTPASGRRDNEGERDTRSHAPPRRQVPHPPHGPTRQLPPSERARSRGSVRSRPRDRKTALRPGDRPNPARPPRRDVRLAVEAGVPIVASTDARNSRPRPRGACSWRSRPFGAASRTAADVCAEHAGLLAELLRST